MLDFPAWKKAWLWLVTAACALAALPSLVALTGARWPSILPEPMVNLGLDLAGGSHILLEADRRQVAQQRLETMDESVRAAMRLAEPRIQIGDISTRGGRLSFMLANPADIDRAREVLIPLMNGTGLSRDWTLSVVDQSRFVLTPTDAGVDRAVTDAMNTATEVVRKRIDALGTREPTIIRQGAVRIVVQVPGLQDPTALKALLGQTAKLEFKLVDQSALPTDVAKGIAPPGTQIFPFAEGPQKGQSLAVRRLGGIRGDSLTNATAGVDPRTNEPLVNIQFDSQGGYGSGGWQPLADSTVKSKAARGLDPRIMHATLRLRRSLVDQGGADQLLEVTPSSLAYGTTVEYAKFHQQGGGNLPRRRLVEPPEGDRRQAVRTLQRFFVTGEV